MAVEPYVAFHEHGTESHVPCLVKGICQQCQSVALPFAFRRNAYGAERQYWNTPAVIGLNNSF